MPKVQQPAPFQIVYFPQLAGRKNGRAWGVKQGPRRRMAREVLLQTTVVTEGDALTGVGVVRTLERGRISVTA